MRIARAVVLVGALCVGPSVPAWSSTLTHRGSNAAVATSPQGSHRPRKVVAFGTVGTGFGPKIPALEHQVPTAVRGIPGKIVEIATSNSDSYALTRGGAVWAWGAGRTGELGNGTTIPYSAVPVRVEFPSGVKIAELANPMPYDSALAVSAHGRVYGWGYNWRHTICLPSAHVLVPRRLPLSDVTLVTGAGGHSLFDAGGHVYACGRNSAGELGNGTMTGSATPTPVRGLPAGGVRALVSSWQGSGALMQNGAYYDWGFNRGGQLGDGLRTDSPVPVKVALPGPVRLVSQGGSQPTNGQTLAVLENGSLWAWGGGSFGQLGDGRTTGSSVPVHVVLPGVAIRQVFTGGDSSYVLGTRGALWAWGGNLHGQLGDGSKRPVASPQRIHIRLAQISATATNVTGLRRSRT